MYKKNSFYSCGICAFNSGKFFTLQNGTNICERCLDRKTRISEAAFLANAAKYPAGSVEFDLAETSNGELTVFRFRFPGHRIFGKPIHQKGKINAEKSMAFLFYRMITGKYHCKEVIG